MPAPSGDMTPAPVTMTLGKSAMIFPQAERGVVAAERVSVVQNDFRMSFARDVGHDVEAAIGIRFFMVDGGRNPAGVERKSTCGGFYGAGRSHGVAQHGLDGTHWNLRGVFAEERLHTDGFNA